MSESNILDLEHQYWQAIRDKNVDAITRLTDDPCLLTGAQGAAKIDRKSLAGMMSNAPWTLQAYELSDANVRMLSDDVAIVAYKVHEELTLEGKPLKIDAADASTWVRRDGHWVCALHTEAIAGDPYGRDRK